MRTNVYGLPESALSYPVVPTPTCATTSKAGWELLSQGHKKVLASCLTQLEWGVTAAMLARSAITRLQAVSGMMQHPLMPMTDKLPSWLVALSNAPVLAEATP